MSHTHTRTVAWWAPDDTPDPKHWGTGARGGSDSAVAPAAAYPGSSPTGPPTAASRCGPATAATFGLSCTWTRASASGVPPQCCCAQVRRGRGGGWLYVRTHTHAHTHTLHTHITHTHTTLRRIMVAGWWCRCYRWDPPRCPGGTLTAPQPLAASRTPLWWARKSPGPLPCLPTFCCDPTSR
jgi:hypothetical protein